MEPSEQRPRILLAEDDADLRLMFRDALQFRGFAVRLAENGEECLQVARETCPDLVIVDIMMPRRNGIETAAELRDLPHTSRVPILALTALADPDIHRRALQAGCDLILNKPIAPGDLLRGVVSLLNERDPAGRLSEELQRFGSQERRAAAELIIQSTDVIRELSAGSPRPTDAELRQRLQGLKLVPACSSCGRVRMRAGDWRAIPAELRTYFDRWTSVSHGMCPDCLSREYPDLKRT